jgi:hypothetical protein
MSTLFISHYMYIKNVPNQNFKRGQKTDFFLFAIWKENTETLLMNIKSVQAKKISGWSNLESHGATCSIVTSKFNLILPEQS